MKITEKAWIDYINRLSQVNRKAGTLMRQYIEQHGTDNTDALITYAAALVNKYGEGCAELACQMYDAVAEASGVIVPAAEPAEIAGDSEIAKMVYGTKKSSPLLESGVSRLVKQAGADTTLKNALRDGAEWAWVPHGDTCAFCITLASRGWQRASDKALKGGHAQHIHANCDCEYAIRFNANTTVAGYDPEKYLQQYQDAGGDINAMRRANYAEHKDIINAKKRAAYAARKKFSMIPKFNPLPANQVVNVLRTEAKTWIDNLSEKERTAIQKYTYNSGDKKPNRFFERLNRMLREDVSRDKRMLEYAEIISRALGKYETKHDVVAYRNLDINVYSTFEIGDLLRERQFTSTSVTQAAALDKKYKVVIYVPKGSRYAYIEGISQYPKQRELLLDRDTIFEVISKKGDTIELKVIV